VPANERTSASGAYAVLVTVGAVLAAALIIAFITARSALDQFAGESRTILADSINDTFGLLLLGAVLALLVLGWRMRRLGAAPVDLDAVFERAASGDLTGALAAASHAGVATPRAQDALRRLIQRAESGHATAEQHKVALERFAGALTSLGEIVQKQNAALSTLRSSSDASQQFLAGVADGVNGLSRGAEDTSSSILQMVAINNEVSENIHNLALSVQETTTAIEEMTFSVKEVARNIEDLSTAAEETAASMNEMDVSISQVETNANETSRLSETVTADAETGVSAINQTIQGIDRIKESSRTAAEVISSLGEKIDEIGNILTVIDDVAEQTNLLALNAAIIAAQAGEHGRGFAVVADEIKALAERTGASTKEIAELIKAVQAESRNAIATMSRGVEAVEEGVQLGHNAEEALIKIVDSAKRSTLMIKAIAQATVEQAKGSKQVANAISRIAETVQQIALATSEQAKGSEQIMKSAERMRTITQQVERSTEEQNRGGRQVTESVESIRDIVDRVARGQDQQAVTAGKLADATADLDQSGGEAQSAITELERILADSLAKLDSLSSQVH
jgi:methyl-accepting chemotaxis protein